MTEVGARGRFGRGRAFCAFVLALLALVLLAGCGGGEGGGSAEERGSGGGGGGGDAEEPPITDLGEISSASDKRELAGRRVELAEVNVLEVPNERSLFVGQGDSERVFVALRQRPGGGSAGTTGGAEEGQAAGQGFEEGQTVSVSGVIRPVPETADEAFRRVGLGLEQFDMVKDEEVFVRATKATASGGG